MISKQVAMTFYYGDPELEINRTKPTPSSPVTDPTNSSQSDTLQVKSPILENLLNTKRIKDLKKGN